MLFLSSKTSRPPDKHGLQTLANRSACSQKRGLCTAHVRSKSFHSRGIRTDSQLWRLSLSRSYQYSKSNNSRRLAKKSSKTLSRPSLLPTHSPVLHPLPTTIIVRKLRPERNLWLRCLCLSSTGTTGSPKKRTFGSLPNALLRFPYPPLNDHVSFRSVLSIATQTDLVLWRLCRLRTISTASLRENNVRILTKGSACPWNLRFRILRQGPIFSQKAPVLVGGIRNFGFRASFRRAQGL
jgi:hypothetical protein